MEPRITERRSPPVRRETIDELTEQLLVVRRVGQWLANETHGDLYARVRRLNELFRLAYRHVRHIKKMEKMEGEEKMGSV